MIDWDYEQRLVDRIAAREWIAARLTARQRRILCRIVRYDETYKDVGEREGIGPARIGQIVNTSLRRLKYREVDPVTRPDPAMRGFDKRDLTNLPPSFDRAAFVRHMQGLIALREIRARAGFVREREALDELLEGEGLTPAGKVAFQPPPPPPPVQVVYSPPPPKTPVEPWFDRARMPTLEDMRYLANYTLGYFVAARRLGWGRTGLPHIGAQAAHIVCLRDADAIAGEMKRMADNLSPFVRLSAVADAVPKDLLGATVASPYVAMRVVSCHGGQNVSIEVTWDDDRPAA